MGCAHVLSEPGQVKLVSHLLSWTRQRWLTEGGSGSQLGKGSSQMKKVHGPRSEPRLVGLQVVEIGGLSGKGRSYLHRKSGLHTELWTIINVSVLILLSYVIYLTQLFFLFVF